MSKADARTGKRFLTEEDLTLLRELGIAADRGDFLQIRGWIREPSGDYYGRDDFSSLNEVLLWAQGWMQPRDVLEFRMNGGERPLPAVDQLPLTDDDRTFLKTVGVNGVSG
jgi:hypothetical protein